jgi:type VI protein secretion system component VasA
MVPALINDDYVIRFAICAQHAVNDDITYAWNVISEMATDVLSICDSSKECETLKEFHRIESLEVRRAVQLRTDCTKRRLELTV